jgi:hypothetical protein
MLSKDSSDAEKSLMGLVTVGVMEDPDLKGGLGNIGDARSIPGPCCPIGLRYFFFIIRYFSP